jgi:hypothetical protein
MTRKEGFLLLSATALFWALAIEAAGADDIDGHKVAAGMSVYLGITPAVIVRSHAASHAEATMHRGPPAGRHVQHLTAALFDDRTGERIEDATVEARVTPLGMASMTRGLEPMAIADTVTYGNYFTMRDAGAYRIRLAITRSGDRRPVMLEFAHQHRR